MDGALGPYANAGAGAAKQNATPITTAMKANFLCTASSCSSLVSSSSEVTLNATAS